MPGYLQIKQTRLYYEIIGQGEPLVLLHAGIADSRMWQPQISLLAGSYQIITLDFRGYGNTIYKSDPFWHYQDVYSLLKHLKLGSVNILGCSLGGRVAIELALQYPEIINRMILLSPGLRGFEYVDQKTLAWDERLERLITLDERDKVAEMLIDIWVVGLRRKRGDVNQSIRSFVKEMILDNYDAVVDRVEEAEPEFDVISRLSGIKSNTLVVIGEEDLPDMLTISQMITDNIPQAKRLILPAAAHMINLEKAGFLTKIVLDFLGTGIVNKS